MTDKPRDDAAGPTERGDPPRVFETSALDSGRSPPPHLRTLAPAVKPKRARCGFWAGFAATVALAAAGASVAAPTLRPLLAKELKARFGDRPIIDLLTGTADPRAANAVALDLEAFDTRVAALAQSLSTLPSGTPIDTAALAQLTRALGQTLDEGRDGPDAKAFAELEGRVGEISAQLAGRLDALDHKISETIQALDHTQDATRDLAGRVADQEHGAADATKRLLALEGETAALRHDLTALETIATRVETSERRVQALDDTLAEATSRLTADAARDTKATSERIAAAALVALAARVHQALDTGETFPREVAAARALLGDVPSATSTLDALEAVAIKGAPSLIRLNRGAEAITDQVVAAGRAGEGPWYSRTLTSIGQTLAFWAPPRPPSAAERIGERAGVVMAEMRAGRLADAIRAMGALSGTPLAGTDVQAWLDTAEKRLSAERASRQLDDLAIARLAALGS